MAEVTWTDTAGGSFQDAADWSTGTVPGASDDVLLTRQGTYTVTSTANETVKSIQIIQNVTLSVSGSTFDATTGSGSGVMDGVIAVQNGSAFEAAGTIDGTGTIEIGSTGNGTELQIGGPTLTLTGGGAVVLSDNSQNYVLATAGGQTLINVDDTISGAGEFAYSSLSFTNDAGGTLDATGVNNALMINPGSGVIDNAGLIEATGVAGLDLQNGTITQSGAGTIKASGKGVFVNLNSGTIVGGTLTTTGGGQIQSISNADLNAVTISAGSTVAATNGNQLMLDNTITNKGTIALDSAGNGTSLTMDTATVTLTGAGRVILSDNGQNYISSNNTLQTLVNVNNLISGSGELGYGSLAITNEAAGTIDATGAANQLIVNAGTGVLSNAGLIEATGTAGLAVLNSTITQTGGTLLAATGSVIQFNNGVITGGTLKTTGSGVIQCIGGGATLTALTVATGSNVQVVNGDFIALDGTITNEGTIGLASSGNATSLFVNTPTLTLTGGGTIALSDDSQNYLRAASGGNELINVNNVIEGAGFLCYGNLAFDNQAGGVIDSTGTAGMTIDSGFESFTNEGLIEDTGTGGLLIEGTDIVNSSTIEAVGAGSSVNLDSAIEGGTLASSAGGVIEITGTGTLDGASAGALTLAAASTIDVVNDASLLIDGTINNKGTIALGSAGNSTFLYVNSAVGTLTGGGTISLSGNSQNYIAAISGGDELVNVNNVIEGAGYLGYGSLGVDNQAAGVIDSTGGGGMTIDSGSSAFTNEGLIEDTGAGGLVITGANIVNTGTIEAVGAGSSVTLNAAIEGGTVASSAGGVIEITGSGTLDGATTGVLTLATGSMVDVANGASLFIDGTISNKGTIGLGSGGNATNLFINTATATLTGGGTISLTDNGQNYIRASTGGNELINVNNLIEGSGFLCYGDLELDNQAGGVIDSTGAAGINIDPGGAAVINAGLIESSGSGGLVIQATTLSNSGSIVSLSGSFVNITNNATVSNYASGTLTGGTWAAIASPGATSVLSLGTGPITVDAATLELSGAGASIETTSGTTTQLAASLTSITAAGKLEIQNGATFSAGNTLVDSGQILLSGLYAEGATETTATGVISANGAGTLSFSYGIENKGTLQALAGGSLSISKGGLENVGTLLAEAGGSVSTAAHVTVTNLSGGTLTGATWEAIGAGATLTLGSQAVTADKAVITLSGAGSVFRSGTGGLTLEQTLTSVGVGGSLNILQGRGFASSAAGVITDSGVIALGGGTFGDAGGLTIAAGGTFEGGGTLAGAVTDTGSLVSSATPAGSAGVLTVTGLVSGAGVLATSGASSLDAAGGFAVGTVTVATGGTISGSGSVSGTLSDSGTFILTGGTLSGGKLSFAAGGTLTGTGVVTSAVADAGSIVVSSGTLTLAAGASGTGSASIHSGGVLDSTTAITIAGIGFAAGSNETLGLGTPTGNTSVISGFAAGATIDLLGADITSVSYSTATDTLTLKDGAATEGTLKFSGSYTTASFALSSDAHGGTDITYAAATINM